MQQHLVYGEHVIPYTIITNKKLKNATITISKEKGVVVKNPGYSLAKIQRFISQKSPWIYKKINFLNSVISINELYNNEGQILLFGEKIPLHVKGLNIYYKNKAKEIVPLLVENWAKKMGVHFTGLHFRKTKRRWGSCNAKNTLSFSPSMVQLPKPLMEYLIVHELAHIKHKHHQKSFWKFIEKYIPNYKELDASLKQYSPCLD